MKSYEANFCKRTSAIRTPGDITIICTTKPFHSEKLSIREDLKMWALLRVGDRFKVGRGLAWAFVGGLAAGGAGFFSAGLLGGMKSRASIGCFFSGDRHLILDLSEDELNYFLTVAPPGTRYMRPDESPQICFDTKKRLEIV